ncbi:MAG: GntR family transcriptional regulator [Spirochaetaceae bacterium]|jgi:GntR family transcriptional regulator of arabinose operon|nr:GntR family transcriptional regulator [Spirochaetaceae bacterium]
MIPKYKIVKEELQKIFIEENYQNGYQLPTEFELMNRYKYSRYTIRLALKELEKEDFIIRVHGKGSFINNVKGNLQHSKTSEDGQKGLIGLVNFFSHNYIYPEIMRGIEDVIYSKGYSLVLSNCNQDYSKEIESVRRLIDQGVKGIIIEPSRNSQITENHPLIKLLRDSGIPVVTTNWNPLDKHFSMVTIDDIRSGFEAISFLLKKGHRNIGMIYKKDVQAGRDRYQGYVNAMKSYGLKINPSHILSYTDLEEYDFSDQGYILTKKMLTESENPPTAIFYFNDNLALQAYKAIQECGLKIPDELSVLGFDDYKAASLVNPPLTTFEHPKSSMGRWAAYILLEEMEPSHRPMPKQMIFEPPFIERGSVAELK